MKRDKTIVKWYLKKITLLVLKFDQEDQSTNENVASLLFLMHMGVGGSKVDVYSRDGYDQVWINNFKFLKLLIISVWIYVNDYGGYAGLNFI